MGFFIPLCLHPVKQVITPISQMCKLKLCLVQSVLFKDLKQDLPDLKVHGLGKQTLIALDYALQLPGPLKKSMKDMALCLIKFSVSLQPSIY